jgi:phosphatidylglycerophosphate synthase
MADIVDEFRKERLKLKLNLPIRPEWVSAAGLLSSFYVVVNPIAALIAALALDLLDGMVARARGLSSRRGLLSDYACDRYSEYIIFGYYGLASPAVLLLPALNTLLTFMVLKKRNGFYVLPLRQILLLYLIALKLL